MGHVDHGKTTLLDYIRKTNVAAREAGGITQSIGAYEVLHNGQPITFIDTPGHQAFSSMRERGARVADIGILVVAVDDSVQPQTKEAFKILQETQTPVVVAINKIDKPDANIDRIKNDLLQNEILLEGFGGTISWQAISAKTGQGVSELLDLVALAAELDHTQYDDQAPAEGFVLESKLDSRRGIAVSAIIRNGHLRVGDEVATATASGKVRSLENFLGKRIAEAVPSNPVLILGFQELPKVGDVFMKGGVLLAPVAKIVTMIGETSPETLNFILKADTTGSLEALVTIVKHLPTGTVPLRIMEKGVGEITDNDVKTAIATNAMVVGFRVKPNKGSDTLARAHKVKIISSDIVYKLIETIEADLKNVDKEVITGDLEILAVFGKKGGDQIIGGKVVAGELLVNARVEVRHGEQLLGMMRVANLQQGKADAKKVVAPNECGLLLSGQTEVRVGDHLVIKS